MESVLWGVVFACVRLERRETLPTKSSSVQHAEPQIDAHDAIWMGRYFTYVFEKHTEKNHLNHT